MHGFKIYLIILVIKLIIGTFFISLLSKFFDNTFFQYKFALYGFQSLLL